MLTQGHPQPGRTKPGEPKNYGNGVFTGLHLKLIQQLQLIQNAADYYSTKSNEVEHNQFIMPFKCTFCVFPRYSIYMKHLTVSSLNYVLQKACLSKLLNKIKTESFF